MTEEEWQASVTPVAMLQHLGEGANARKLRLFACACWLLRAGEFVTHRALREAVLKAERIADGEYTPGPRDGKWAVFDKNAFWIAGNTSEVVATIQGRGGVSLANQADLLRDIFGNPFRPVTFAPVWRTDTAVSLARQMYEARDFAAMPILADALQDAGCDNADILAHCRDPKQVHVRGCWVVDLVLGKE